MTAHEFNNGDSRLLIDRSIQNDFTDSRRYISGSAAVAGGVVGYRKIVVNGFWNADKNDILFCHGSISGQFVCGVHGIISADVEYSSDIHGFKFFK